MQNMDVVIADTSTLFLLPDPVTCFHSASYKQTQTFRLSKGASAVVLDWVTSGRKSLGEEWVFHRYYSANEFWVDGKRIAKDVMLLDDHQVDSLPQRTLKDRLSPYSCYATVFLYGPMVKCAFRELTARYETVSVFKTNVPAELVWSLSPLSGAGCVMRVAGNETERVRGWLGDALRKLETAIGVDAYRTAFPYLPDA
jgi:urease accessory protein